MRTIKLTFALFALAITAPHCFAAYQYYFTASFPYSGLSGWTQPQQPGVDPATMTSIGLVDGFLGSTVPVPDGTNDYEVMMTLGVGSDGAYGGDQAALLRATFPVLNPQGWPNPTMSYYAVMVGEDTSNGCSAGCPGQLAVLKFVGQDNGTYYTGQFTQLATTAVPCSNGMVVRAIMKGSNLSVLVNNQLYLSVSDSSLPTGMPGVGFPAGGTGSSSVFSISQVSIGPIDRIAPSVPSTQQATVLTLPNRVDAQWQGAMDDPNGVGVELYSITRNGSPWITVPSPEFTDETVAPGTTYQYGISACDYHGNCSGSSTLSVTTAPAGTIDSRRVGVRPDGTYWGGAGEQIDTRSGNLSFSVPLLKAVGRGGSSVGFALNYNSQLWRQSNGVTWQLGHDVGYGLGWQLLAGSITPYWSGYFTVDHYIFRDSTGAEYNLSVNNNGTWTSAESGVYVGYNAAANQLYFTDGSFWQMGSISSGLENDAGTRYPTVIEDRNGNQITITYQPGNGLGGTNSSARITQICDPRAGGNPTYTVSVRATPPLTSAPARLTAARLPTPPA
jgi:hypothetical protein